VFGFLAWGRYSPIVPAGLYDQINVARNAIGTGPYKMVGFNPNDRVEYVANKDFWKAYQPYMDAMTLKTLTDEQARIAALRAGAIDGATLSEDGANAVKGDSNLVVLKGGTAAFRELQITIKGDPKPWHDVRVRQAVNMAIDRQAIINVVYGGNGNFSGIVPPGYGPWPLSQAELKTKYQKVNLVKAKALMAAAGQSKGFSVNLSTFSTPLDFQQVASVIKSQLQAINIDVNIVAQEPGTFAANNGTGNFDWDLTARGMRGDVDGYLNEYNPANTIYQRWYPLWKNKKVWRDVGNGKITLDPAKRAPLYRDAQLQLQNDLPEIGLVQINKYQVVNKRVQGMYVAFDDFNTGLRNTVWLAS
jgi:peptide/nickel transport system substrate-binding protein